MFGRILNITDSTIEIEINKNESVIPNLMNLHVVFMSDDSKLLGEVRNVLENSILIGLLPDIEREKFEYIGNSSLVGTYLTLISNEAKQKLQEIGSQMTYVELSVYPSYMDEFISACFLPHTNIEQFPTVKELIES